MRFQQPLDGILGSAAKVRILRFLCRKGGEWSGRQIAARLAMNPVTAHRALRQLREATLLNFHRAGASFLYSLRDGHYLVRDLLRPMFGLEERGQERLAEILRRTLPPGLKQEILTVALYGSVARGEERPASDLDLLVLVRSEQAKRRLEQTLGRLGDKIWTEFGNAPALYIKTVHQAQEKVRHRLPLFDNILKDHRVLYGEPLKEVLHGQAA